MKFLPGNKWRWPLGRSGNLKGRPKRCSPTPIGPKVTVELIALAATRLIFEEEKFRAAEAKYLNIVGKLMPWIAFKLHRLAKFN